MKKCFDGGGGGLFLQYQFNYIPAYSQPILNAPVFLCACFGFELQNHVYLQRDFAVLSIVANHRDLCWKQWPVRGVFCRLVRICSELIFVFASKSSTRSQIYLLERERDKSIHTV